MSVQAQMRSVSMHNLVNDSPKLSRCYGFHESLATISHGKKIKQKQKTEQMSRGTTWLRAVGRLGDNRV